MADIMKIVEFLEEYGLLRKTVCKTIENELHKQKVWFF